MTALAGAPPGELRSEMFEGTLVCRSLSKSLSRFLASTEADLTAPREALRPCLQAALAFLEADAVDETAEEANQLLAGVLEADVPAQLLLGLGDFDFEAQKDAARFFRALVRRRAQLPLQLVEYVRGRAELPDALLQGCANPEVALHCGQMLRALTCSPELVAFLLECNTATQLMGLATSEDFDIASESFTSLRELLLNHKQVTADYVCANYETFFAAFHSKLIALEEPGPKFTDSARARSYVTARQGLRLLGEMLLAPEFSKVMRRYSSDVNALMITMNFLRDDSKLIKLGAFHVFKVFVANPQKTAKIDQILRRNKAKLLERLTGKDSALLAVAITGKDEALLGDLRGVESILLSMAPLPTPCRASTPPGVARAVPPLSV